MTRAVVGGRPSLTTKAHSTGRAAFRTPKTASQARVSPLALRCAHVRHASATSSEPCVRSARLAGAFSALHRQRGAWLGRAKAKSPFASCARPRERSSQRLRSQPADGRAFHGAVTGGTELYEIDVRPSRARAVGSRVLVYD
jgi:hypothetical protein